MRHQKVQAPPETLDTLDPADAHYFQQHGLTAEAPEALNESLRQAIGTLDRLLYPESNHELTETEIAVLRQGGVTAGNASGGSDPLAVHAVEFAAILQTSLSPGEVAEKLAVSATRVRQTIQSGALFAVRTGGRWRVPRFQFGSKGLVPNIGAVNAAAPRTLDAVSLERWYRTPDPDLPGPGGAAVSPLDWLRAGRDPAPLVGIVREL